MSRKPAALRRPARPKSPTHRRKLFMEGLEERLNMAAGDLLISEYLANPAGTDSPFEYVELLATRTIDFSTTPYSVVFANNGTVPANGWVQGGATTYGFNITSGTVAAGDVVYVGGSTMAPTGTKLRVINTGTTAGDGFGSLNSAGVLGNGGTGDGIAVFDLPITSVTSSTVPIDAILFGTSAPVSGGGTTGYELPANDRYTGGKVQTGSFIVGDPANGTPTVAVGSYAPGSNTFPTIRTWTNGAAATATSEITLGPDTTPPTVSALTITTTSPAVVTPGTAVAYTVTFSEPMLASTVEAADFVNLGTAPTTTTVATTGNPAVYTVTLTPTGTNTGTIRLQIPIGATLTDLAGNQLGSALPVDDETTVDVAPSLAFSIPTGLQVNNGAEIAIPIRVQSAQALTANEAYNSTRIALNYDTAVWDVVRIDPAAAISGGLGGSITNSTSIVAGTLEAIHQFTTPITGAINGVLAYVFLKAKTAAAIAPTTINFNARFEAYQDGGALFPLSPAPVNGADGTDGTITIVDREPGGTTVTEGGATDTLSIVLGGTPTSAVLYSLTPSNNQISLNGAAPGDAIFLTISPANANTVQTVTVTAFDDVAIEGNHTSIITIDTLGGGANNAYNGLSISPITVNIIDNDTPPAPTVTFEDNDADNLISNGNTQTYTLTFSTDIDAATFTAADLDNAGTATFTIGTITETTPTSGIFNVQVTPTSAGTLILRIPTGAVITSQAGANLVVPVQDNDTVTVNQTPGVTNIDDGDADNLTTVGTTLTYTVTFNQDIDATTVLANDFANAGTATIAIGTITETTPTSGVFTVQVTPSTTGTIQFRVLIANVITSTAGGNLGTITTDNDTVTVNALPTVTSIDDGDADNTVTTGTTLTYTVTFDQDIDATTVTAADFNNAGSATIAIGTIAETTPTSGIFTVQVTPSTTGTVILRIPTGSVITSTAGGNLAVPVSDNDTVTVTAASSPGPFINEILFSPGDFSNNEYVELRGTASAALPANTYFVVLSGNSGNPPGQIKNVINLSGQSFGANGFLAVVQSGHPFSINASSNVFTTSWGAFENSSASYLLITSATAPILGGDADSDDNGVLDGVSWTILDSVAALDASGADLAYATTVFKYATGSAVDLDGAGTVPAPNVIRLDQSPYNLVDGTPGYLGRLGNSTGSTVADWLYADTETMTTETLTPRVYKLGANLSQSNMVNTLLNHLGTTNPSAPPPPGVVVSAISGNTTEAGGTATFSVMLNTQPTGNVTIPVSSLNTSEGTVAISSLTFTTANWNVAQTVTVTGVNDNIDDGDVPYVIDLGLTTSTDSAYNNVNPTNVSVINTDDDTRGVIVSAISGNTTEAGGTATFTIRLATQPTADVTIPLSSSNPAEGTVGVPSVTFTTSNWNTNQTVTVTGVNDAIDDGDILYQIITGVATGGDYGTAAVNAADVNVTNTDDDTRGVILGAISGNTTEAGGTATFTIRLATQPTADVTIPLSSSNTAEGTVGVPSVTFTTSNWNTNQTVTVTGVNDAIDDGDILYQIITGVATGGDYGTAAVNAADVNVTNVDDDTRGVIVSAISGNTTEAGGTATFTIRLATQPTASVTIPLTSSNTAEGTVGVPSVTFTTSNWNTNQTVTVTGVNDFVDDGDIAYTIQTGVATGGDYGTAAVDGPDVAVTNTDNDTRGVTITPTSGLTTTESGGTATFTVVLDSQPTANVTITFVSTLAAEGTISPSSLTFTTANWNSTQTITITGQDDLVVDGNLAYSITSNPATSADPLYNGFNPADVSVTNNDNDTPTFTVNVVATTMSEGAGVAATTVQITRNITSTAITVNLSSSDTTEATIQSTVAMGIGVNTITVPLNAIDDFLVDGAQTVTITASLAGYVSGTDTISVTDNDSPGVTVNPTSGLVTTEAGGTATFTIVLNTQPTADVVIGLVSSDTTEGSVPASVTFTNANWNLAQTITVTGVNDAFVDGNIAYTIVTTATSADTNYNGISVADVALVNNDNDVAGVTVTPTSGLTTTEAGGTASFSVVLTSQPSADVVIGLVSSDTTEGGVPTSITFTSANWNVAQNVTVVGADDPQVDGNIAYTIVTTATSADTNYNNITVADVSVTNTDNDVAGVTVTPTSGLVTTEAGGTASFSIVLNTQPTANVTINLSSSNAAEGTVPASVTFTSANWSIAQNVTVTGVDDAIDDGNIAYTIITTAASSDSVYNNLAVADVAVTNNDNDTAGVTVTPTSGLVTTEAGGTATFSVVLTSQPTANVTINLSSNDTTEGTVPASITFTTANWNTAQTVTVTGVNDLLVDGNIAYTIITTAASSDATYNNIAVADVSVTNTDNDVAGVTVSPTSGLTTTEAGGTATFTIVLNTQPTANVTIGLTSSDLTEGTVPANITFTTANWNTAQTVTVTGVNDSLVDGNIAYTIVTTATSSDPIYNNISVADVSVTNTDNDAASITVTPTAGLITTEAGGAATFTVSLGAQPSADVVVNLSSSNTSEGTVPTSITFTTLNWNTPQTVTVTGVDDFVDDGNVAYTIVTTVTSSDAAFAAINPSDVALTNTDNDTAGATVTQSGGTTNVAEGGATDTLSFVLSSQPTSNVVITLNTGAQLSSNVPTVTFTPATWNIAQVVTISAVDDAVSEGNHTGTISFTVASSDSLYNNFGLLAVTANIADNDNVAPTAVNDGVYNMFNTGTLVVNNVGVHGLGVLANDIDPDTTTLTAILSPAVQPSLAGHTLNLNSNGSFTFTPSSTAFTGTVTFTYIASDGLVQSAPATVTINVIALTGLTPVINATPNADNIIVRRATNGTDVEVLVNGVVQSPFPLPYSSLASVTVNGLGNNDNYQVDFTNGDPIPPAGLTLDGGAGTDTLNVGGMDAITTGRTVTATETTIDGIGGGVLADITFAAFEGVNLSLTGGADVVTTDLDNAVSPITTYTINGRGGDDTFLAPAAANIGTVNLWGGTGNDTFGSSAARVFPSVTSRINVSGEEANTGANVAAPTGDRLWLDTTNASGVVSLIDTVGGNVQGIGFSDMMFHGIELFDAVDNGPLNLPLGETWVHGYNWESNFDFYGQNGSMYFGYSSPGGTRTFGALGMPSILTSFGGGMNDTMSLNFTLFNAVRAAFYGNAGNDKLYGSGAADLLVGGAGNDTLTAGGGNDELWGDDRATLTNGVSRDGSAVGDGADTLYGNDGDDFIFGGGGADYILGGAGQDYMNGGLGGDILSDQEGDNYFRGGDGNDQLAGGPGRDIMLGGLGADRLIGRAGADFMFGGDGADVLQDDSAGADVSIADISPYDADIPAFTQVGSSVSGYTDSDLALLALMYTGGGVRPNAWSGASAPGATTATPTAFAARVGNLAGLAASLTADADRDTIIGQIGDPDYILSELAIDFRMNELGDTLYYV